MPLATSQFSARKPLQRGKRKILTKKYANTSRYLRKNVLGIPSGPDDVLKNNQQSNESVPTSGNILVYLKLMHHTVGGDGGVTLM